MTEHNVRGVVSDVEVVGAYEGTIHEQTVTVDLGDDAAYTCRTIDLFDAPPRFDSDDVGATHDLVVAALPSSEWSVVSPTDPDMQRPADPYSEWSYRLLGEVTTLDVADEYYVASHDRLFRLDVGPWSALVQPSTGLGDAADDGEVDVGTWLDLTALRVELLEVL